MYYLYLNIIFIENEIKVFFEGQDTERATTPAKISQIYLEQWRNLQSSEKFNNVSMRFVNPAQLNYLAHQIN
jgi:hypothetical protein